MRLRARAWVPFDWQNDWGVDQVSDCASVITLDSTSVITLYGARKKVEAAWKQLELLKIGILVPRLHVRMQCSLNTTTVQISCCHFGVFTAVFIAVAAF